MAILVPTSGYTKFYLPERNLWTIQPTDVALDANCRLLMC